MVYVWHVRVCAVLHVIMGVIGWVEIIGYPLASVVESASLTRTYNLMAGSFMPRFPPKLLSWLLFDSLVSWWVGKLVGWWRHIYLLVVV